MTSFFELLVTRAPFISLFLLLIAGLKAAYNIYFMQTSVRTMGKVIEIEPDSDSETPLVEFKTQEGKTIKFRVTSKLNQEDWSMGSTWPVRYLPSSPEKAQIDRQYYRWIPVGLFVFAAGVSFVALNILIPLIIR